ncbi:MAG: SDR family NAD(P)-dependent oxidoreductase [Spirochaetales bacterium]|nr:SDR family NAD(P)-dependent oxidoreductase [Spirochaetales bacterium]
MDKKICIVTGANAGIGKQAACQIAKEGYHVIMACRNKERGKTALDEIKKANPSSSIELQIVDLGLRESVVNFVKEFNSKYERLDVLVHNAAIFNVTQKVRKETAEGIETLWATNHLGPVLMTQLLQKNLEKSDNGRIITIASKGLLAKPRLKVNLDDPEFLSNRFNVVNAYYQSKLAQIIYTLWLSQNFKDTNITANCIRVTAVKIDISRHPDLSAFMKWVYSIKAKNSISPEDMAKIYTDLAVSSKYNNISGKYFDEHSDMVTMPKYCIDKDNIKAVMELTKKYIPEIGEV